MAARPLLVVTVGSSLVAMGHALWIWRYRTLGALDPDEAGYLAAAFRMRRAVLSLNPWQVVTTVGGTGNGITVPLLSVPLVLVGPLDPRTAMLVQPALMVLTAVSVAGIVRRFAGPGAAIAAGLLFAVLPTVSTAAQSYWYGVGATAALATAMWALLRSERASNRWIWVFGVAVGLMWLTRTMTLGYAPAVAFAGLAVAGFERRRLLRLAGALVLAVGIAGPWYFVNRGSIFRYLFSYGYGQRAGRFGEGDVVDRARFRLSRMAGAFGSPTWRLLWGSAVAVAVFLAARAWWRSRPGRASQPLRGPSWLEAGGRREAAAVALALVAGQAALVSTTNQGVWFELPMVALAAALLVAVIAAGPRWFSLPLAAVVAWFSLGGLADQWWWREYRQGGPTSHYEAGFAQYDPRFDPTRRSEQPAAAAAWARLSRQVLDIVRPEGDGRVPVVTISGNMQLFNSNTLELAGELESRPVVLDVPDTAGPPAVRARHLTRRARVGGELYDRILVIADHDYILFTPDERVADFARQARSQGWVETDRVPMPRDGVVRILRRVDGAR